MKEIIAIEICAEYGSDNWADIPKGERQDLLELSGRVLSLLKEEIEKVDYDKIDTDEMDSYYADVRDGFKLAKKAILNLLNP